MTEPRRPRDPNIFALHEFPKILQAVVSVVVIITATYAAANRIVSGDALIVLYTTVLAGILGIQGTARGMELERGNGKTLRLPEDANVVTRVEALEKAEQKRRVDDR